MEIYASSYIFAKHVYAYNSLQLLAKINTRGSKIIFFFSHKVWLQLQVIN